MRAGDVIAAECLIDEYPELISTPIPCRNRGPPLSHAANIGQLNIVVALLRRHPADVEHAFGRAIDITALGLRDGRIFVTVGTRWPGQLGCTARVLEPEGSDLDSAPDLVVRADSLEGDTGYPWSVELNDGRVLVVYYYTYPDGQRGIEGTVVEEV